MNFIEKYFKDTIDYPDIANCEILKDGDYYEYIAHTFLNGFINYVEPLKAFVIDRYNLVGSKVYDPMEEEEILTLHVNIDESWKDLEFNTKNSLHQYLKKNVERFSFFHTDLRMFQDDVMFLGESDDYYFVFHFDMDVSDCCVGKFKKKNINKEELIIDFQKWCLEESENRIFEFKKEWIKGWVKF